MNWNPASVLGLPKYEKLVHSKNGTPDTVAIVGTGERSWTRSSRVPYRVRETMLLSSALRSNGRCGGCRARSGGASAEGGGCVWVRPGFRGPAGTARSGTARHGHPSRVKRGDGTPTTNDGTGGRPGEPGSYDRPTEQTSAAKHGESAGKVGKLFLFSLSLRTILLLRNGTLAESENALTKLF